jgi:hypothetical protein
LEAPDLDLIKQAEQGWGLFGNVDCAHLRAESVKAATHGGRFAADLLQEQQRLDGA